MWEASIDNVIVLFSFDPNETFWIDTFNVLEQPVDTVVV